MNSSGVLVWTRDDLRIVRTARNSLELERREGVDALGVERWVGVRACYPSSLSSADRDEEYYYERRLIAALAWEAERALRR